MERIDYINPIKAQRETIDQLKSLMETSLQTIVSQNKSAEKKNLQIERLIIAVESLNNELQTVREQLGRLRKDRFGSSSFKHRKGRKASDSKKSRDEEREDCDNLNENPDSPVGGSQ